MGNTKSSYERHEDDEEDDKQQRINLRKDFHLLIGEVNFPKRKKGNRKQNELSSSSSSNSSMASSSDDDDHQSSLAVEFISIDLPFVSDEANEFDIQTFKQYLIQQQPYGKELIHLYDISFNSKAKSQKILSIYYDQSFLTEDFNIEKLSLLNEESIAKFTNKTILSIYSTKSQIYLISRKNFSRNSKYKLAHSNEDSDWLEPFIHYSNLGYRLCGIVSSSSITWLFEENDNIQYDYCLIETRLKTFSLNKWKNFFNLMFKQEWKLVTIFNSLQTKKATVLLFFQRLKH